MSCKLVTKVGHQLLLERLNQQLKTLNSEFKFVMILILFIDKMVSAWYMDNEATDQRLPHKLEPNQPVSLDHLAMLGVLYFHFTVDDDKAYAQEGSAFNQLKKERGYSYEDTIVITREKLPNYDEKIKNFFTEHLHTDEEIRFILDGSGYFDVRDVSCYKFCMQTLWSQAVSTVC